MLATAGMLVAVAGLGCTDVDPHSGYSSQSLYPQDIRTVYVEMFESESFRREIEYELTRALATQLELHSPLKVLSNRSKADTVIYGSITGVTERVLSQQRTLDRPIENQMVVVAEVTWKDLRSGELIMDHRPFIVSSEYAVLLAAGRKSAATKAGNDLAVRIVESMEKPWWE